MSETILRTDKGQPRPKYISINVELTSTFLLYRGLVHHHHRIVYRKYVVETKTLIFWNVTILKLTKMERMFQQKANK